MQTKEILKELVSFNTIKDNQNEEIMNYIQKLLEAKGFKVEYKSKCLIMSIKNETKLGFIGHTDTVQSGTDWSYNPLELTQINERLYGLGTCDMKGGIAGILKATLDTDWNKLNFGIKLFFTYDEEIGFQGIKEIVDNDIKIPENIIVGEPTNNEIMNGTYLLQKYPNGIIISGVGIITNGKDVTFVKECYSNEFKHIRSIPLIKWEIMKKYINKGYKKFDLGDITIAKNQITKTGYNGNIIEYTNSFDLVINEMLYKLNGIAKMINKN